jgi:hypothetical protein
LPMLEFLELGINSMKETYLRHLFAETDGIFAILLPSNLNKILLSVCGAPLSSNQDLASWIEGSIIATEDKLISIQERRVLGATREIVRKFENIELLVKEGSILVEIEIDSEHISEGKMLCIMNSKNIVKPDQIFLIIPNEA